MQLCSLEPFGLNNVQEYHSNKHLTQSRPAVNRSSRPKSCCPKPESCRPKLSPNAVKWNPDSGKQENLLSWDPASGKKLRVESRILGFEIQNKTLGIRNPTSLWNPETKIWNPVPGIRNPWLGNQNPILSWIPLHGAKIG